MAKKKPISIVRKPTYDNLLPNNARAPHGADEIIALAKHFNDLFGLPKNLVPAAALKESGLDYLAKSPTGPMGLMQLGGATRKDTGVTQPFDPEQNLMGGAAYYRLLTDDYKPKNLKELSTLYTEGPGAGTEMIKGRRPYTEQARAHYLKIKDALEKLGMSDHLIEMAKGPVKRDPMEITIIGGNGTYSDESMTNIMKDLGIDQTSELSENYDYAKLPPKAQAILDKFKKLYPVETYKPSMVELPEKGAPNELEDILNRIYKYDLEKEGYVQNKIEGML
jgi:hypothetical protein